MVVQGPDVQLRAAVLCVVALSGARRDVCTEVSRRPLDPGLRPLTPAPGSPRPRPCQAELTTIGQPLGAELAVPVVSEHPEGSVWETGQGDRTPGHRSCPGHL